MRAINEDQYHFETYASLLREIRILAAEEEGTSISAMLWLVSSKSCASARALSSRRRALARLRDGMSLGWTRPDRVTSFTSDSLRMSVTTVKQGSPKYFVDTNILLYAHDREAARARTCPPTD